MKIGILGSSFDPPHFGHLLVARQTKEIAGLDQIWLMPYYAHNWDDANASAADRFAMTGLIEERGIEASDEEVKYKRKSYTVDTVRRLKSKYNHEFYFIIGSDILPEFHKWKEPDVLIREAGFLVFPRFGYPLPSVMPAGFTALTHPEMVITNISSTVVRTRLVKGLSVVGLIPDRVLEYITKHNLYEPRKS
jgi:nicotinate-nucleotide adenylyltransferase